MIDKSTYKEVLLDTINAAAVIIGRGSLYKSEDIAVYTTGIRAIGSHLLSKIYDFSTAGFDAAQVMYLAANILADSSEFTLIKDSSVYNDTKIENKEFSSLNPLRKISLDTYAYIVEATKLL